MKAVVLAVDLGAESGRVMAAEIGDGINLREMSRFINKPIKKEGHLRWDMESLWRGILEGFTVAAAQYGDLIKSISFDTWAVDFALINNEGELIEEPVCYRDPRTEGLVDSIETEFGKDTIWKHTGIRNLPFNTVFQLLALKKSAPEKLKQAESILMIPDFLAWKLCGVASNEWTNASSTALASPSGQGWDLDLIKKIGLGDLAIFDKALTKSGIELGTVSADIAEITGLKRDVKVLTCASHDTASAAALTPAGAGQVFISSGTWSLMGMISEQPLLSKEAKEANLSNELAWDGRSRPLKNIMGLWVLQNCRRTWNEEGGADWSYPELVDVARSAADVDLVLDVDDAAFFEQHSKENPYADRVVKWFADRGVQIPADEGNISLAVIKGLAHAYANTLKEIEKVSGQKAQAVTILGGGGRNELLVEMTAQLCDCPVRVGAHEATALGNAVIQAFALDLIKREDIAKL
ncbi:FGGY family carbohydrate kinase [Lentisphaera profundi]|uniref:FGGY family carbohydrate kinase n=1 Tax=Lentisphaera profundi TaxID=1658616 RepID=A0ABY7VWM4_9BACT|nr:FGGY-family carbohydrate kinase [Lentisphaera profundi]WDE97287.1 FGGY family carbohydrate kinase [Lentisphaera profundi]